MRFFLTALLGIAATVVRAACKNGRARQAWPSEQYEDQKEGNENGSSCADHVSIPPYHRHVNSQNHRFSFHRFRFVPRETCAISPVDSPCHPQRFKRDKSTREMWNRTSAQQIQRRRRRRETLFVASVVVSFVVVGFGPLSDGWLLLIEAIYAATSVMSPMGRGSGGSSRYCT